jgi:Gram-negative bacterial TonB protein C-terminal
MKKLMLSGCLPFLLALSCMSQTQQPLCPKHIETPTNSSIARTAHVSGTVVMTLTIDADGKVSHVKVTNENEQFVKLLERTAITNIHLWTFAKPPSAPFKQSIAYDFRLDDKLPPASNDNPIVTYVTYDLPNRVTIRTNGSVINPN